MQQIYHSTYKEAVKYILCECVSLNLFIDSCDITTSSLRVSIVLEAVKQSDSSARGLHNVSGAFNAARVSAFNSRLPVVRSSRSEPLRESLHLNGLRAMTELFEDELSYSRSPKRTTFTEDRLNDHESS
ncbi:unnamed protein product [Euphydryas editha]|uniref:Uncharacterized protein n=1 Tax=Euphydryas editha TaxID=104508 RepID=A0AAU9U2X8_EUPED|nr:unnamed protein product [Euphydryas editha]